MANANLPPLPPAFTGIVRNVRDAGSGAWLNELQKAQLASARAFVLARSRNSGVYPAGPEYFSVINRLDTLLKSTARLHGELMYTPNHKFLPVADMVALVLAVYVGGYGPRSLLPRRDSVLARVLSITRMDCTPQERKSLAEVRQALYGLIRDASRLISRTSNR